MNLRIGRAALAATIAFLLAGCGSTLAPVPLSDAQLGYQEFAAGHYPEALAILERAYKSDPNDPYVTLNLGATYDHLGQIEKALSFYTQVLESGKTVVPVTTSNGVKSKTLADMAQDNLDRHKQNLVAVLPGPTGMSALW